MLLLDLDAGAGFFEGEEIAAELGSADAELGFEVGEADAFLMALESTKKLDQANALGVAFGRARHESPPISAAIVTT